MSEPETMMQASAAEIERLQCAIGDMNDLASYGFKSVAAIARLARIALEQPEEQRPLEAIMTALQTLASVAYNIGNEIDVTAETATKKPSSV